MLSRRVDDDPSAKMHTVPSVSPCSPSALVELGLPVAALAFRGFSRPQPRAPRRTPLVALTCLPATRSRSLMLPCAWRVPCFLFLAAYPVTSACRPCLDYPHKSGSCRNSTRAPLPVFRTSTSCCSLASLHLRPTNSSIYSSSEPVLQSLPRPADWYLVNPPSRPRLLVGRRHARGGPR